MKALTLTRYIPQNATEFVYPELNAVAYFYESNGKWIVIAYSGKKRKPDFHFSYPSAEKRQIKVNEWLKQLEEIINFKKEIAAKKKAFKHSLHVGKILAASWGYDQTNVNFYEVVEIVSDKSIVIREIRSTIFENGFMRGRAYPLIGQYIGEPMLKRVRENNLIRIESYILAKPWDGQGCYNSWYA